jgi:hypothetical protein
MRHRGYSKERKASRLVFNPEAVGAFRFENGNALYHNRGSSGVVRFGMAFRGTNFFSAQLDRSL